MYQGDEDERRENCDLSVFRTLELEERRVGDKKRTRERHEETATANQKKTEEITVEQSQDQEPPMPGEA